MATRDMPSRAPAAPTAATTITTTADVELGSRDAITSSASSSPTPDDLTPKRAATTHRRSIDGDDDGSRHRTFVARCSRKARAWVKGPEPVRTHRIAPVVERLQTLPVRLLGRLPPWAHAGVLAVAFVLWAAPFGVILHNFSPPSTLAGFGPPLPLTCVTSLWANPQACGLNGQNCLPFDNSSFAFNCPANCLGAQVLNPRAVGNISVNYRALVVGGAPDPDERLARVYRGDSFVCGAAIHAGVINNAQGGCGVVSLVGEKAGFRGVPSNGISSIAYDSTFPMAFAFNESDAIASASRQCRDPRWNLLPLSTVFTALFGLFAANPAAFFAPVFTIMFFQVGMASDPPPYPNYQTLASITIGRFLPAALVAALFYQFSVRKSLRNCHAHVEKTVLWVGGAWVGSLNNYTFDKIPIQRLTGHDIRQQPGAITALVIIVLVLFVVILYQCWNLRNEGRLPRYLGLYVILGVSLGILSAMPRLTLRIHHYIIALLLLPGTAMQTRISLLCQGLLVGLFINGIARWGFDPILQTAAALRGDAQLGSGVPAILEPIIDTANNSITFTWNSLLRGYEGVSIIVNDVERYRGRDAEKTFTWFRKEEMSELPEYFRFGFVNYALFGGVSFSDFTRAGTWFGNDTWSGIAPGRT